MEFFFAFFGSSLNPILLTFFPLNSRAVLHFVRETCLTYVVGRRTNKGFDSKKILCANPNHFKRIIFQGGRPQQQQTPMLKVSRICQR